LHGVSVRRPVSLTRLRGDGEALIVRASRDGDALALELDHGGQVAVVARGSLVRTAESVSVDPGDVMPRGGPTYGGALFHGPAFQVVHDDLAVGPHGASATVDGLDKARWDSQGFAVDVPAVDALLQVAVRWAETPLGSATLPMGIDHVRLEADAVTGSMGARICGQPRGRVAARVDANLVDPDGRTLVALTGVSLIARPDADQLEGHTTGATA
jgi:hypothetical protein